MTNDAESLERLEAFRDHHVERWENDNVVVVGQVQRALRDWRTLPADLVIVRSVE